MARHKDKNWNLPDPLTTWEELHAALLMDIRNELQAIRRRLDCHETLAIPKTLEKIRRNTAKPRRTKDAGDMIARLDAHLAERA